MRDGRTAGARLCGPPLELSVLTSWQPWLTYIESS
jgi:hypothetical protein